MIEFNETPRATLGGRACFVEVGGETAPKLRLTFANGGEALFAAMAEAAKDQPSHIALSLLVAVAGARCLNLSGVPAPPARMDPEGLRAWALEVAPQVDELITAEVVNAYMDARGRPQTAPEG